MVYHRCSLPASQVLNPHYNQHNNQVLNQPCSHLISPQLSHLLNLVGNLLLSHLGSLQDSLLHNQRVSQVRNRQDNQLHNPVGSLLVNLLGNRLLSHLDNPLVDLPYNRRVYLHTNQRVNHQYNQHPLRQDDHQGSLRLLQPVIPPQCLHPNQVLFRRCNLPTNPRVSQVSYPPDNQLLDRLQFRPGNLVINRVEFPLVNLHNNHLCSLASNQQVNHHVNQRHNQPPNRPPCQLHSLLHNHRASPRPILLLSLQVILQHNLVASQPASRLGNPRYNLQPSPRVNQLPVHLANRVDSLQRDPHRNLPLRLLLNHRNSQLLDQAGVRLFNHQVDQRLSQVVDQHRYQHKCQRSTNENVNPIHTIFQKKIDVQSALIIVSK